VLDGAEYVGHLAAVEPVTLPPVIIITGWMVPNSETLREGGDAPRTAASRTPPPRGDEGIQASNGR
jgi:hypothetical protein